MPTISPLARRAAVAAGVMGLAIAAAASFHATRAVAANPAPTAEASPEPWLARLTGTHRQLFDNPAPDAIALVHVMNYYDTYNKAYSAPDSAVDAVVTLYGANTFHGVSDAMWAKYRIGEHMKLNAPGGTTPATANPWRTTPHALGMALPQASIESLQRRGATFILCNNALTALSGMLATARGLEPAAVYADLRANVLPGVEVVPAMVIAVEQAQRAGVAYKRE